MYHPIITMQVTFLRMSVCRHSTFRLQCRLLALCHRVRHQTTTARVVLLRRQFLNTGITGATRTSMDRHILSTLIRHQRGQLSPVDSRRMQAVQIHTLPLDITACVHRQELS